ncbi:U32 family peptidase [Candidatus Pacearchaeota archaeon]|nr:MAG: U32 family peptidase [Candidatus Pacearchaeota archaeon]
MVIELLAPAGSFQTLLAAVDAGADAVYFGLKEFSMRAFAKNFRIRDLPRVKRICSSNNVKMYLTLNTIVFDNEVEKLEKIVKKVKPYVDAIICWDFSVISLCKKYKIPFHISTQASVANSLSAKFFKKLGADRIVLARELNLKQIEKIAKIMDVECFAHGAMCMAISGRCFMSEHFYKRSANRGECVQLCRRSWKIIDEDGNELRLERSRLLSAKDLCTLPFIEKLKKLNVKALKIEGRNRSPEYVKTVVSVYREAIDRKLSQKEIQDGLLRLEKVYNRGFSSGFYLGLPTADDFSESRYGEQRERKEFVGKVLEVLRAKQAGRIYLNAGKIKAGDEVYLLGNRRSVQRTSVTWIEAGGKKLNEVSKGHEAIVGFGVSPFKNDEVYIIVKRNEVL